MNEGQKKLLLLGVVLIGVGVFSIVNGMSPLRWYLEQLGLTDSNVDTVVESPVVDTPPPVTDREPVDIVVEAGVLEFYERIVFSASCAAPGRGADCDVLAYRQLNDTIVSYRLSEDMLQYDWGTLNLVAYEESGNVIFLDWGYGEEIVASSIWYPLDDLLVPDTR